MPSARRRRRRERERKRAGRWCAGVRRDDAWRRPLRGDGDARPRVATAEARDVGPGATAPDRARRMGPETSTFTSPYGSSSRAGPAAATPGPRTMKLTPRIASAVGPVVALDADSVVPLYEQLYQGLRTAIVDGRLRRGARMPGTRMLADDLGISRNTATLAYDQLSAEGYLERRQRGGTFVARVLPDRLLLTRRVAPPLVVAREQVSARALSARGAALAGIPLPSSVNTRVAPRPFRPGVPALDQFPVALWSRLSAKYWRRLDRRALAYGHSAGHP